MATDQCEWRRVKGWGKGWMDRRGFGRVRNWRLGFFGSDDSLESEEMVLRTSNI